MPVVGGLSVTLTPTFAVTTLLIDPAPGPVGLATVPVDRNRQTPKSPVLQPAASSAAVYVDLMQYVPLNVAVPFENVLVCAEGMIVLGWMNVIVLPLESVNVNGAS